MTPFDFKKWNNILGWTAFGIALLTYCLTVEPTMSFWDCGEYIATAANLEVGHPPGAPLFQMLGAFFALFAVNKETIALMVNMLAVFSSAFSILFLFWSSTILMRKIVGSYNELTDTNNKVILGASLIGALTFTFSDSFWFNAVEAEVYAMAMFMIALLLWLGLRWEQEMHTPKGNKWLLLISLMVGLSFGVHFMALLTIPSIGFLYYFKNYKKITLKNFLIANGVIIAILLFIFKLLLPYTLAFFAKTEIFMVNSFGLPFNSGTIFAFLLIIVLFYTGLRYTRNQNLPVVNTALLCVLFVLIGFSTWIMLPIRANANTPINENNPSDAAEVLAYYNREQYGVNPLFYGPQYTDMFAGPDEEQPYLDKSPNYERDEKTGKYVIVNNYKNAEQNSNSNHRAILPRMWSTDNIKGYVNFVGVPKYKIRPEYMENEELLKGLDEFNQAYNQKQLDNDDYINFLKYYSEYIEVEKPTFWQNVSFMIEYQFGYMYGRYLLWNFVGRQNDNQGRYDNLDGNWMSGIKAIDEMHLGSQDNLPDDVKNNKGRNFYYFLPFFLGILGFMYHAQRDLKSFYVILTLFLFTGLALKIYLNERPFEPRERDYALVGSFYVFALWVGFGVYAIYELIAEKIKAQTAAILTVSFSLLAVPVLMASENWDDHDRSNRYTAIAMAKNYLDSCDKNAILFTIGDNDTFPLWYAQEIEGYRTDVRIVNTSLLMTDWYIDQMKQKVYDSEGLPISFTHSQIVADNRDIIIFQKETENRWNLNDFIAFAKSEDTITTIKMRNEHRAHFFPTNKVRIPVDKATVLNRKLVNPKQSDSIVPFIDIDIKGGALYKNRLIMLDILNNNHWKRPIYFSPGSFGDDDYLWMKEYLQLDGMVYKLVPIKTPVIEENYPDLGQIDTDKMYPLIMKWQWGNGELKSIYHDPETRRNCISTRGNMARTMDLLIKEGKIKQAKNIIELALAKMPLDYYGYYLTLDPFVNGYYKVGEKEKARELALQITKKYQQELLYYSTFNANDKSFMGTDIISAIERYRNILKVVKKNGDIDFYNQCRGPFNSYNNRFKGLFNRPTE
ncbi:DUF2723 domain-containing protein [Flavobacterium sp.]|uniref:glycosyltransferase family 117 protein n=1 Tax=Flavobacterium sp. TaxID=239 RepID=UPI0026354657|nr:DUF2723 domain-containing protein [Flavobacterium sp.]